ncbi:thiol S-methyltransferase METTL7B-like isoform X2 [Scophthalmus maximus]|uniref:thiol S-methyltransferase METTL7B-like isoform X2 n=1 Tax=Scophthalmus maximus TaxID=52904 RepID=UPI001FA88B00|nr:thiol S-methyltransferase METTL7B-like isoform X2 [Scophthalmus maximus]
MKYCLMKCCRLLCLVLTLPLNVMEITGLCALYKRVFPLLAYNITFSYNAKMLKIKRELFRNVAKFANADGTLRLLEIGCGSGANFQFYPYGCTVICSDPNPHFDKYLRRSMEQNKHLTYGELVVVSGEDMGDVQDESVDVVVCTLVLCSVSDVRRVLQEVRRVLRTIFLSFHQHNSRRVQCDSETEHIMKPTVCQLLRGDLMEPGLNMCSV